jgi:hypothetical protein
MTAAAMRVLITTDAVGGVWNYSLDLARGLAPLGIETVIAMMGPSPSAAQRKTTARIAGVRLVDTGQPLDWLAPDAAALAQAGEAIARLTAKHQADIIQLNAPALAAEVRFPAPVVAVLHSCVATWWSTVRGDAPMPQDFRWRTDAVAAGLASANVVVTPTQAFGEMVQLRYALDAAPRTVHNGRSRLATGHQAPHDFVFTAGRLWDRGKNLRTLDLAAASIGVPVHAAGPVEGPHGERVAFDHLHSLGNLDNAEMDKWLSARPVFVSAALYEPFGLSVLEAAAAGCPLILSDIPTFRELWDGAAIFIDPTDPAAFALACNELVGDDFERAAMGRAARERAATFTPEAMAVQMADIYRSLLPTLKRPVAAAQAA